MDPSRDRLINAYFALQLLGGIGLIALLVTLAFPSPALKRYPTLILLSLCVTWVISTAGMCLLFFAGQLTGPPPSPDICLAQAVFVIAQPPMTSVSTLAFILHVWLVLSKEVNASTAPRLVKTAILLSAPYIVFVAFAFIVLHIGSHHPDLITRHVFYCSMDLSAVTIASALFTAATLIAAIIFCAWIAVLLRRHFGAAGVISEDGLFDLKLRTRVVIFGFYLLLGIGLAGAAVADFTSVIPDMFVATNGIAIVATFGSQREILRTWRGWFYKVYSLMCGGSCRWPQKLQQGHSNLEASSPARFSASNHKDEESGVPTPRTRQPESSRPLTRPTSWFTVDSYGDLNSPITSLSPLPSSATSSHSVKKYPLQSHSSFQLPLAPHQPSSPHLHDPHRFSASSSSSLGFPSPILLNFPPTPHDTHHHHPFQPQYHSPPPTRPITPSPPSLNSFTTPSPTVPASRTKSSLPDDEIDSQSVELDLPPRGGEPSSPLDEMLGMRSDWVGKAY